VLICISVEEDAVVTEIVAGPEPQAPAVRARTAMMMARAVPNLDESRSCTRISLTFRS
jgi:hypothetical protein